MISVIHIMTTLSVGGAERVTIELVKVQRQEGLDAQFLSLGSESDSLVGEVRDSRIPLYVSPAGTARLIRYRDIVKLVKQFQVIHIHSPRTLAFLVPILPFISHRRIIYTRHGLDPLDTMKWKLVHYLAERYIDHVSFVTQSGYDVFCKNHHWNAEKLKVISNGVALKEMPYKRSVLPLRFGSVGRMVKLKGQHYLLNAMALLEKGYDGNLSQICHLHFFGGGPVAEELHQQARTLPVNVVTFHGEEHNIDEIYKHIDVLVVSSESEGLSMVIIEAMARGIPVIATDVGGNPSLVIDRQTGLLIPFGRVERIAESMLFFIDMPELVRRFGLAARRLIESRFSIFDTHRQYLECYRSSR